MVDYRHLGPRWRRRWTAVGARRREALGLCGRGNSFLHYNPVHVPDLTTGTG
ncbi:MAG: hypothetical protein ACYDFT_00450 [Thermoplasmata archaeon]